jgi:hypothetical protein
MEPRTLQLIQRGLVAAVTVVLALVVVTAFIEILEPSDAAVAVPSTTTSATLTPEPETATTLPSSDTVTTTTTDGAAIPAVCLESEPADENVTALRVFYPCGPSDLATGQVWVYRAIPKTDLVLTATLREMVKGVDTDEVALGFRSPFPEGAEGSSLGTSISDGTAYLEFSAAVFPEGVDTPEGAQIFLSTLNANVFKFDTIQAVEYRLGGSCDAFWQQLGSNCQTITRAQWQSSLTAGG